jgi:hypothetical protein
MAQNTVDWSDTIFDINKWEEIGDTTESREVMKVVYYIMSIILYIISFKYLFENKNTEYSAYIFLFILNSISPFLWIEDFRRILNGLNINPLKNPNKNLLMTLKSFSMGISSIFVFISFLLVITTNERIRKMKMKMEGEGNNISDLDVKFIDYKEYKDKVILISFVSIIVIIWAMIGETFSSSNTMFSSFNKDEFLEKIPLAESGFTKIIKWLLDQPYAIIQNIEQYIHNFSSKIKLEPMIKMVATYCVTFIVTFFGLFVRIPKRPEEIKNKMDRFKVINMSNVFTPVFYRRFEQYKHLSLFTWGTIISLFIGWFFYYFFRVFILSDLSSKWKNGAIGIYGLLVVGVFAGLFGGGAKLGVQETKVLVMSVLAFMMAVLGTPVVTGLLSILNKVSYGLIANIYNNLAACISKKSTTIATYTPTPTFKLSIISFIGIFFGVMISSTTKIVTNPLDRKLKTNKIGRPTNTVTNTDIRWIDHPKSMRLFMVVLVCMLISLVLALSMNYKIFTHIYTLIKSLLEMTVVYIAPFGIIAIAIMNFVFSKKNHDKILNRIPTDT